MHACSQLSLIFDFVPMTITGHFAQTNAFWQSIGITVVMHASPSDMLAKAKRRVELLERLMAIYRWVSGKELCARNLIPADVLSAEVQLYTVLSLSIVSAGAID
jgi:hypothetical protein